MKPFNLEAFKNGAVALTHSGSDAHFLAYDEALKYPLIYRIGNQSCACLGTGMFTDKRGNFAKLIGMKPTTTKTVWVNLYKAGWYSLFDNENSAKKNADESSNLSGCWAVAVKVEIEE